MSSHIISSLTYYTTLLFSRPVEIWAFHTLLRNQEPKGLQELERCLSTCSPFVQFLLSPPWLSFPILQASPIPSNVLFICYRTGSQKNNYWTSLSNINKRTLLWKNINACFRGHLFSLLVQISFSCGLPLAQSCGLDNCCCLTRQIQKKTEASQDKVPFTFRFPSELTVKGPVPTAWNFLSWTTGRESESKTYKHQGTSRWGFSKYKP